DRHLLPAPRARLRLLPRPSADRRGRHAARGPCRRAGALTSCAPTPRRPRHRAHRDVRLEHRRARHHAVAWQLREAGIPDACGHPVRTGETVTVHRSTIRVALVGAGAMGSLHARVVTQSQDTELAWVVDPDAAVGAPLAERFRTRWVPEVDDFDHCDAGIGATPT